MKGHKGRMSGARRALMRPLRLLCAEHCLSQVQHATHKHPREVDKQCKGVRKDSKACGDSNARDDSDACNTSASSSTHALIKRASEGELCVFTSANAST